MGFGAITSYLWGTTEEAAIWIAAGVVWIYTACGGLFSVAYTDVVQGLIGWTGYVERACSRLIYYYWSNHNSCHRLNFDIV